MNEIFSHAAFADLYNYRKFTVNNYTGEPTGKCILLNKCEIPFAILDIDFGEETDEYKESFIADLLPRLPENTVVVQSPHKGIHMYCTHNLFPRMNRYVKIVKTEHFDLDLFFAGPSSKNSLCVVPNSKILDKETNEELYYCFIKNDFTVESLPTIFEVVSAISHIANFGKLNELLEVLKSPPSPPKLKEDPVFLSKEYIELVINGIKGLQIYDQTSLPIEKGVSLDYLFPALNSLTHVNDITEEDINQYYKKIYMENALSDETRSKWETMRNELKEQKSVWSSVVKIVNVHNKQYSQRILLPFTRNYKR